MLTLPSPTGFHVPATQHRQAIVLQRTGTVTLAESAPGLTAQPAQQPAEPLRSAGTVKIPEMAGTSASIAPVKSIDAQAGPAGEREREERKEGRKIDRQRECKQEREREGASVGGALRS